MFVMKAVPSKIFLVFFSHDISDEFSDGKSNPWNFFWKFYLSIIDGFFVEIRR